MNNWQLAVIALLALGFVAQMARFAKTFGRDSTGQQVAGAILFLPLSLALPFCLYMGGFFK